MTQVIGPAAACVRTMPRKASPSWGEAQEVVETGRSTCRICGAKIAKGERGLVTFYSFDGSGFEGNPWVCTEIHVHAERCPQALVYGRPLRGRTVSGPADAAAAAEIPVVEFPRSDAKEGKR